MNIQLLSGTILSTSVFAIPNEIKSLQHEGQNIHNNNVAVPMDARDDDLHQINSLKNPPLTILSNEDIYVRRCRLAGTAVDAKWGCFRVADLPILLERVQGAPALIGHNRNTLAVARFFGGTIETHQGYQYIVPKLYWLKGHSRAEDLRLEIDGGLVTEASIAFTFRQATCCICEKDIRLCAHSIGESYEGNLCFVYYDGIEQVLEGSLVFRGAEPYTAFLPNHVPQELLAHSQTPLVKWQGKMWRLIEKM